MECQNQPHHIDVNSSRSNDNDDGDNITLYRHELVHSQFQIAGHTVEKGHKGFLTVPSDIVEYGRIMRLRREMARRQNHATSDNKADLSRSLSLPELASEKHALMRNLPATDLLFKPILKKISRKEGSNKQYTFASEIDFYEQKLRLVPELRQFVPAYYGIRHIVDKTENAKSKYILLQDLTKRFKQPSIMDIKIGRQTYVDTASPEKKQYEISKNPFQHTIGFRISGMKVYRWHAGQDNAQPNQNSSRLGSYVKYDRKWSMGKRPGKETQQTLEEFFFNGEKMLVDYIPLYIEKLVRLLDIFRRQTKLRFIASSLLLMYESDEEELERLDGVVPIECKVIDFAHTHHIPDPATNDEGFIHGIEQLLAYFRSILQDHGHDPTNLRQYDYAINFGQ